MAGSFCLLKKRHGQVRLLKRMHDVMNSCVAVMRGPHNLLLLIQHKICAEHMNMH
jgi:hypothetical protein